MMNKIEKLILENLNDKQYLLEREDIELLNKAKYIVNTYTNNIYRIFNDFFTYISNRRKEKR